MNIANVVSTSRNQRIRRRNRRDHFNVDKAYQQNLMPLVVSNKAKRIFVVRNEQWLGEILGHRNFDGENWEIGDSIVFEDGECAFIEKSSDGSFHVWSSPKPGDLSTLWRKSFHSEAPR